MRANSRPIQYRDELEDRKALKFFYSLNQSYRKTADDFEVISDGIQLHPSMVRLLIMGYQPGKKIRKVLNWPPLAEVPACADCGAGHAVGWCTERYGKPAKPRPNSRPRKPPWYALPESYAGERPMS